MPTGCSVSGCPRSVLEGVWFLAVRAAKAGKSWDNRVEDKRTSARCRRYALFKNMTKLVSAFSFNMISADFASFDARKVGVEEAAGIAHEAEGMVGHEDTAVLVKELLGLKSSPYNRTNVAVGKGDTLLLAQYSGPRLEPGTMVLPPGAKIVWWVITIE